MSHTPNFIMNLCSALTAYCFYENKPKVLLVYMEKSRQLELFILNLSRTRVLLG